MAFRINPERSNSQHETGAEALAHFLDVWLTQTSQLDAEALFEGLPAVPPLFAAAETIIVEQQTSGGQSRNPGDELLTSD